MNKAAFWFTNFVLCSNILKYPMFLLIFYVVATEHPYWPEWIFSDNSHPLIMLIVLGFPVLVIALHFLFKMRVFIFLYKHSKEGSYSRNFFEKFRDDSDFSESVITRAMVADTVYLFAEAFVFNFVVNKTVGKEFLGFLFLWMIMFGFMGTGVFLSYECLGRWLEKQKKLSKNSL